MTNVFKVAAGSVAAALLCGCSDGVKEHIRAKDFRSEAQPAARPASAPSPIANVADMPGWTTDIEGAQAFGTENASPTILFVQNDASPANRAPKQALTSAEAEKAIGSKQKVVVDINTAPDVAQRFGVSKAPALLKIDPSGAVVVQKQGSISKAEALAILK